MTARPPVHGSAEFSDETPPLYRWRLDRWWGPGPRALICGANPSAAGAERNDPTIWRVIDLTLGRFHGFTMVNPEPFIATDHADLLRWRHGTDQATLREVRRRNCQLIREISAEAAIRIIAWGDLAPDYITREMTVAAMSLDGKHPLYAFDLSKNGRPKHPMARGRNRIANDAPLVIWQVAA